MTHDQATTEAWIRNPGDQKAAANGCRFHLARASYVVWWIERFCKLYEGSDGDPLILRGCHQCHADPPLFETWDEAEEYYAERAEKHNRCIAAGHAIDWQYESVMRLFGWVKWSDKWNREVRRFQEASIWVAKKNKKSPTLAAIGLYLLIGDEEPGQKVFLAAKDGQQAKEIAGKHAIEMLMQSPELMEQCTINKVMSQITHEGSRSILKPLSSANQRTQQSKEGLNGSVLIDETHVVDRAFISRISRAGISRAEPIRAEFSTAGNNPDGYGKQRFDYAMQVERGDREDETLFVALYAAPQNVTDNELEADPLKYARLANPAMGHTVEPEEFLRDYHRSRAGSVEEFNEFKMYRLNIWQAAASPVLKPEEWAACASNYAESDLLGKPCFGGLDLSLRWDLTAFVLVFPWGLDSKGNARYRIWPYMFLPHDSVQATKQQAPWLTFEKNGHLKITDGNATDFPLVRRCINEAKSKFKLISVAYDDRYAESFAQALQDEDKIEVVDFQQGPGSFLEPLEMFENLVRTANIEHPNDSCLNWQAGHVVKNRRGMLDKPPDSSHKKIDGIVSLVMGLGLAMKAPHPTVSVYETRGVLQV